MNDYLYQVSIIIINYNTPRLLKDCIQSVRLFTQGVSYEIIVVDNASKENPADLLHEEYPEVRFVISPVNLGFGKANNLGVEHARGEYLFFLNSDTLLLNDAVTILYCFMKDHPDIGICGGNLYDADGKPNLSYFKFPSLWREWKEMFGGGYSKPDICHIHNMGENEKAVDCISGADLMISRQLFSSIGGFDKDFFLYYEETEMTYRCRKRGYLAYSVPQARIVHYHGMSTTKKGSDQKSWAGQEFLYSKFLYYSKAGRSNYPFYIEMSYLFKAFWASIFYQLMGKKDKVAYWAEHRQMIREVYNRYLSFIDRKSSSQ